MFALAFAGREELPEEAVEEELLALQSLPGADVSHTGPDACGMYTCALTRLTPWDAAKMTRPASMAGRTCRYVIGRRVGAEREIPQDKRAKAL
jgi:hypothetical protein